MSTGKSEEEARRTKKASLPILKLYEATAAVAHTKRARSASVASLPLSSGSVSNRGTTKRLKTCSRFAGGSLECSASSSCSVDVPCRSALLAACTALVSCRLPWRLAACSGELLPAFCLPPALR